MKTSSHLSSRLRHADRGHGSCHTGGGMKGLRQPGKTIEKIIAGGADTVLTTCGVHTPSSKDHLLLGSSYAQKIAAPAWEWVKTSAASNSPWIQHCGWRPMCWPHAPILA